MKSVFAGIGPGSFSSTLGLISRRVRTPKGARNLTRISVWPYVRGAVGMSAAAWLIAAAYLLFMPPSYTSRWTFILPAAASGTVVSLDTIGQSVTQPSQGFAGPNLSPKVIYKEIIESEPVRLVAAKALGLKLSYFPKARVKLIDETALILMEISGSTAEEAQRRANVLINAFNDRIDYLRRDEMDRRADTVTSTLKSYQVNLRQARERILDSQQRTGVLSLAQFQETASSLELARRKLADVSDELARQEAEQQLLIAQMGVDARDVAVALKLASDASFTEVARAFAEENVAYLEARSRLGVNHPFRIQLEKRRQVELGQIEAIAHRLQIDERGGLEKFLLVSSGPQRAELFKSIVSNDAFISGGRHEVVTLKARIAELEDKVKRMSIDASKLEDLNKDHLVAQAVFTSAVARLDTNRADIYASYPMVQVLSAPDLPEDPSQPNLLFAVLGGGAATCLIFGAWGLYWIRAITAQKRSKSA